MCFSPARVGPTPYCFGPAAVNMQREVFLIYCVLSSVESLGHWRDTKSKDTLSGEETQENRAIMWISVEDYIGTMTSNWDSELLFVYSCPFTEECLNHSWDSSLNWYVAMLSCHACLSSVSMVTHLSHRKWVNWFFFNFVYNHILSQI